MNTLQIKCAIPAQPGSKYKGIAFDGCLFYLTCSNLCEIIKLSNCFCQIERYKTQKPYTCICYDPKEDCFWAASEKCYCKLFKLDKCFNEIDCIVVRVCNDCGSLITGVSYDCQNDCLIAAFTNCIILVDKLDCSKHKIMQMTCNSWNMDVLSISPDYIVTAMQEREQNIYVYGCENQLKFKLDVPSCYIIESILFHPCEEECVNHYRFYILATKNGCYPFLLEWIVPLCDIDICPCNFCICNKDCRERPCPHPPNPGHFCNDIIESIALIEAALSHILNAEGEKLQKIIATSNDVDEILVVNKAVNKMVVDVTHLEIVLHDKLAAVKEICVICNDECCDSCWECPQDNDCNNICDCDVDGGFFYS